MGQRVTIADVALACAARDVLEPSDGSRGMLGPRDLAGIPHILRWYRTVTHNRAFSPAKASASFSSSSTGGSSNSSSVKKQKQQQKKKQTATAPAASGGAAGAGAAAAGTRALPSSGGGGGGGGDAGEHPVPIVGESGDLTTSASVVQGARRLELAPARFTRKRVRVRELLANGAGLVGQKTVVKGWLRTARAASKGALLFLVVDDGSCSETVQVCLALFFAVKLLMTWPSLANGMDKFVLATQYHSVREREQHLILVVMSKCYLYLRTVVHLNCESFSGRSGFRFRLRFTVRYISPIFLSKLGRGLVYAALCFFLAVTSEENIVFVLSWVLNSSGLGAWCFSFAA